MSELYINFSDFFKYIRIFFFVLLYIIIYFIILYIFLLHHIFMTFIRIYSEFIFDLNTTYRKCKYVLIVGV